MKRDNYTKKDIKDLIINGVSFTFGTFCLALCYNLFFAPNNIIVGGMSGLALILNEIMGINTNVFIYASSIFLLILSYIFLGKDKTKNTVIGTFLYPLFITLTEPVAKFLLIYLSFQQILVTVVLASLLYGFSNGLIYKFGYSTGGVDVIIQFLCKYFHLNSGTSSTIVNIFIILFGGFVFGVDNASYAIIILVVSSIIVDKIIIGISTSKKFMIYTREIKKVKQIIMDDFNTGYTIFPTIGGYSHKKGTMIMCVISNKDVNLFKDKILEVDNDAFFVIDDCYEVQGGIKNSNIPFFKW